MKAPQLSLDPRAGELLARAQEWRLIGRLFERPTAAWREDVARLAEGCSDPLLRAAGAFARQADEGEYHALLGPGGVLPAREAGYRRTADPARSLAEIRSFHAAFAFESRHEDPIDHLSVLCGFVAWLYFKEAYALAANDAEAAEVTREAAARFVRAHLAPCAEPLAAQLEPLEVEPLRSAAQALLARTGPRPTNVEGDWVPHGLAVDECTVSCALGAAAESAPDEGDELPPEFTAGLPRDLL